MFSTLQGKLKKNINKPNVTLKYSSNFMYMNVYVA